MHRQIKWLRITQLFEDRKSHKIYHSFCSSVPTIALTDQCTWHLKMKHHLLNNTSGTKHVSTPLLYFVLHLPHLILGIHWYTLSRYFGYRRMRSNFRAQFRHQVNTLLPLTARKTQTSCTGYMPVTEGAVQTYVFCSIRCQKWTQHYAKWQKNLHLYLHVKLWPEFPSSSVPKPKQNEVRDYGGWTACEVQDKHKEIRDTLKAHTMKEIQARNAQKLISFVFHRTYCKTAVSWHKFVNLSSGRKCLIVGDHP